MKVEKFNKVLGVIISVLVGVILIGTVVVLATGGKKTEEEKAEVLVQKGKAVNLAEPANTDVVGYYDLGKIRVVTLPEDGSLEGMGSPIVLHPWLEYPQEDTVFYEELARKQNVLKSIFTSYFTTHTRPELQKQTESIIEQNLLTQINSNLSLGQISDIYFTDYLYLE